MKTLIEKMLAIEREISEEKGKFTLFALFLREDAPGKWDLIVAASWFAPGDRNKLDYLTHKIQSRLKSTELLMLSRIVVVDPSDTSVQAIQRALKTEHSSIEVRDSNFFGLTSKYTYVIISQKVNSHAKAIIK